MNITDPIDRIARLSPGATAVIGPDHPGVTIEAVDADDRPLPPGAEGILRIRSANCIDGHLWDAAASPDRAFRNGWFYCGDTGAVSEDGLLSVAGRVGEFINSGGRKISPLVIEEVLLSLPQIREAAAFGAPDKMGVVQIWAAIVADSQVETATLRALCRARLAERSPKFIIQMKELPRYANGKVVREELIRFATTRSST
jgi:long-chain acyl-CoA synthetase